MIVWRHVNYIILFLGQKWKCILFTSKGEWKELIPRDWLALGYPSFMDQVAWVALQASEAGAHCLPVICIYTEAPPDTFMETLFYWGIDHTLQNAGARNTDSGEAQFIRNL